MIESPSGQPKDNDPSQSLTLRPASSFAQIDKTVWNDLATANGRAYNPFISYDFLKLLEDSGSCTRETGWLSYPLLLERGDTVIGVAPAYIKGHSQGEYIFDHHWADAYHRAGGQYFPKLLIASPFSPVPGPRLLCENDADTIAFAGAIAQLTEQMNLSSAHVNFCPDTEQDAMSEQGFLPRIGEQYHWFNRDYSSFDDFLSALSSRKRKTIRQERRKAVSDGISIVNLKGSEITESHWDHFWVFYQDTGARKWGTPYLTRESFSMLGERMADDVLLTLAFEGASPEPIAGALHMIGGDALYGRYWGATQRAKFLHFECCYYQAIDYAIEHKLARVEAGAQGHHKIARGYEPCPTYSAHYIPDPGFRRALEAYLDQERRETEADITALKDYTPFRKP